MAAPSAVPPPAAPVPPHDLDAEESILGAMLLSPAAVDACQEILADGRAFYRHSHTTIYLACLTLRDRGEPVDAITVADQLDRDSRLEEIGGRQRIHELATIVPAAGNASHYARIIRDLAGRRELCMLGERIMRLGWDAPAPLAELQAQVEQLTAQALNGAAGTDRLDVETWHEFESRAHDRIPTLIDGLWPEAAFGFIAAPPKKGKTWLAIAFAVAVTTGRPFLGHFTVPDPHPALYVALEGHRAGIRARVGAVARGMGVDPDSQQLDRLHWLYKPAGINLADPAWARGIRQAAERVGARLVVVDVLRAAARIKENDSSEFAQLRWNLQPVTDAGISVCMLHHFGKLTELQKDRDPGERLSGTGAMFGALDAAIYITGSKDGATRLRLEFDTRDLAAPDHLNVHLTGDGSGDNGGYTYRDTATFETVPDDVAEDDLKAPAEDILHWLNENGGEATTTEIRLAFDIDIKTLRARHDRLGKLGVTIIEARGKATRYVVEEPAPEQLETLGGPWESPNPGIPRVTPDSQGESLNHAGLPDTLGHPGNDPLPGSENAGFAGETTLGDPGTPYGSTHTRARAREAHPEPADNSGDGYDRRTAEQTVRAELWQHDDPETAILERWPDAPALEVKRLGKLARRIAADEAGT